VKKANRMSMIFGVIQLGDVLRWESNYVIQSVTKPQKKKQNRHHGERGGISLVCSLPADGAELGALTFAR